MLLCYAQGEYTAYTEELQIMFVGAVSLYSKVGLHLLVILVFNLVSS